MRTAFIQTLEALADENPRTCLIVGDLGHSVIERFAEAHPNQFVNAGVAEQNMIGLATGLALSGRIVFTYSIGNFATLTVRDGRDITLMSTGSALALTIDLAAATINPPRRGNWSRGRRLAIYPSSSSDVRTTTGARHVAR